MVYLQEDLGLNGFVFVQVYCWLPNLNSKLNFKYPEGFFSWYDLHHCEEWEVSPNLEELFVVQFWLSTTLLLIALSISIFSLFTPAPKVCMKYARTNTNPNSQLLHIARMWLEKKCCKKVRHSLQILLLNNNINYITV